MQLLELCRNSTGYHLPIRLERYTTAVAAILKNIGVAKHKK